MYQNTGEPTIKDGLACKIRNVFYEGLPTLCFLAKIGPPGHIWYSWTQIFQFGFSSKKTQHSLISYANCAQWILFYFTILESHCASRAKTFIWLRVFSKMEPFLWISDIKIQFICWLCSSESLTICIWPILTLKSTFLNRLVSTKSQSKVEILRQINWSKTGFHLGIIHTTFFQTHCAHELMLLKG